MQTFREQLLALAHVFGVDQFPWDACAHYAALVHEVNQETNLVGSRTDAELVEILFGDALQLVHSRWLQGELRAVDLGSGVGAPMIPLALALPDLRVTLVEARRRRVAFLRRAIGELNLQKQVEVLETSVDPKHPAVPGAPFDVALSRATWPIAQWLTIGSALAPQVIAFATPETLAALPPTVKEKAKVDYTLPAYKAQRSLLLFSQERDA